MTANEFINATRKTREHILDATVIIEEIRPRVHCADGYSVSMQVGDGLYCEPRCYGAYKYSRVELGYPSAEDELINDYAEDYGCFTDTVYPYVPVEIVDKLFEKHGGIVNEFMALEELT